VTSAFGSVESFTEKFTAAAMGQFGSGWAWLVVTAGGKLEIYNLRTRTARSRRATRRSSVSTSGARLLPQVPEPPCEYVKNWWNVVNWQKVGALYHAAKR